MALDLSLDDELRREGLAREIVHAIQNARREAGLAVEDRIELALSGDASLLEAARAHEPYVSGETLAVEVSYDGARPALEQPGQALATVAIEGRELTIGLRRAARPQAPSEPRA